MDFPLIDTVVKNKLSTTMYQPSIDYMKYKKVIPELHISEPEIQDVLILLLIFLVLNLKKPSWY